ncbi:MAG: hypothetical protein QXU69_08425 [Thermofilaceae archaeon]
MPAQEGFSQSPKSIQDGGEGSRMLQIEVNAETRSKLSSLYTELIRMARSCDSKLRVEVSFRTTSTHNGGQDVAGSRKRMGRSTSSKDLPPIQMPVKFKYGGRVYGDVDADCIVDLDSCLLKIGSVMTIPLRKGLCEALKEELSLSPPPLFKLLITADGELKLFARRSPPPWWVVVREECDDFKDVHLPIPIRVVGVSMNNRTGVAVVAFDVSDEGAKMIYLARWRPPGKPQALIEALRSYAEKPDSEKRERVLRLLPERLRERLRLGLTTVRARSLARKIERGYERKVVYWERRLVHQLRVMVREVKGRAVIAVDASGFEPSGETNSQGATLRIVRRIEVMAKYEGAYLRKTRVEGERCPLCGGLGVRYPQRGKGGRIRVYYGCGECYVYWDRDYGASFGAVLAVVPEAASQLRTWLRGHPLALARNLEIPSAAR